MKLSRRTARKLVAHINNGLAFNSITTDIKEEFAYSAHYGDGLAVYVRHDKRGVYAYIAKENTMLFEKFVTSYKDIRIFKRTLHNA